MLQKHREIRAARTTYSCDGHPIFVGASLYHVVLLLRGRPQPSVRRHNAFAAEFQFFPRKREQVLGSRFIALRRSRLAIADINSCGTNEQVAAESGSEQHAFGSLIGHG